MRKYNLIFALLLTFIVSTHSAVQAQHNVPQGSFHISQLISSSWIELYVEPFTVNYQTKSFPLQRTGNRIDIEIVQKSVSYGDIESVLLYACGTLYPPKSATYIDTYSDLVYDLSFNDHNVVTNHEQPIQLSWELSPLCQENPTLILNANEYESPESRAFRFPASGISKNQYSFSNNGSLIIDGILSEVDNKVPPLFSPFWQSSTGHPSNNTPIYIFDDTSYVYFGVDILLDNTNDFGHDWLKIIAYNHVSGKSQEYRVDDYSDAHGICAFGYTSKVSHKHQSCEIRIPKSELSGNQLDYSLKYYGTSGGGEPTMTITQVSFASTTPDLTPSITGTAVAVDGAAAATSVQFGLADSHAATEGSIVPNYDGTCTANDGAFDETTEPFTCTTSTLDYGDYKMFILATNGSQSATNSSAQFTVYDSLFTDQINSDGFGDVLNIETSTMTEYDGVLYAGTTQTAGTGAELWSFDGSSWTEETSLGNANLHKIDSLIEFNSALYASVVDGSTSSLKIWKYEADTWTEIDTTSLSNPTASTDENSPLAVFNNALYVGTVNSSTTRAEIWSYNGSTWSLVNTPGFSDPDNIYVSSLKVFNSNLYAGISNATNGTEIWKYNGSAWTQVNNDGFGVGFNESTYSLEVYNGTLYAGTYNTTNGSQIYAYSGSGTTWTQSNTSGFGTADNQKTTSLHVFNGKLYAGTANGNGSEIWEFDGSTWTNPSIQGFRSTTSNSRVASMLGYHGILYAGSKNEIVGTEVWKGTTDTSAPALTLTAITDPTSDTTPTLIGSAIDSAGALITAIQFQVDSTSGSWAACTADDGTYNESSEAFICSITEILSAGNHTIYVRATDSNSNTTSLGSLSSDSFTVSGSSSTPTPTPTPTPTSSPEQPSDNHQIPQGQSQAVGGAFTPVKDSYTGEQAVTVIVEPGTFKHDAFFSAQLTVPQINNGILDNPLAGSLPSPASIAQGVIASGDKLGLTSKCGISWQVGSIQQMWYKTYPPSGTNVKPAIIIPELQEKPSIVAMNYSIHDLIPPGQPNSKHNPQSFALARSREGTTWKILPTSVVDIQNQTVAGIDSLGGYYMIVSHCLGQSDTQKQRETSANTLGTRDSRDKSLQLSPTLNPVKQHSPITHAPSPVPQKKGILQHIQDYLRKILNS